MIYIKKVVVEVLSGPIDGDKFELLLDKDKIITIGRLKGNDIILPDMYVSRSHAQIIYENGKYWIEDYSRHGTFIDEKKIHNSKIELAVETILKVGSTFLKFKEATEKDEIVDMLSSLHNIFDELTLSELDALRKHPEVEEIERRLIREGSRGSDLKVLSEIMKDLIETIRKIIERKKLEKPVSSSYWPIPTELNRMTNLEIYESIKNILESSFEKKFG